MPRTGRPREFDRNDALRAARDVFWTRGYADTSIQDLVDALGVQRGSLYGAFGDKRALYLEAVALYWRDNRAHLEAALDEGPVLPVVRQMLTRPGVITGAQQRRGCLIGNTTATLAGTDEGARELVTSAYEEFVTIVADALRRAHDTGEIDDTTSPETQAWFILLLFQGSALLSRALENQDRLDAALDLALGTIAGPVLDQNRFSR